MQKHTHAHTHTRTPESAAVVPVVRSAAQRAVVLHIVVMVGWWWPWQPWQSNVCVNEVRHVAPPSTEDAKSVSLKFQRLKI